MIKCSYRLLSEWLFWKTPAVSVFLLTPSRNFKRPTDGAFIKEAFMCLFPERNPDSPWM